MKLGQFHFVTVWHLAAPVEVVWEIIARTEVWPVWWRGVLSARLLRQGADDGSGYLYGYVWRSILPYKLYFEMEVTRVEPCVLLEGVAHGDVVGVGRWTFEREGGGTRVQYNWDIRLTNFWVAMVATLTAPLVRWNHDVVMAWGRHGLERRLAAERAERNVPA